MEEDDRVFSYANIGRQRSSYGSPFPSPRHCHEQITVLGKPDCENSPRSLRSRGFGNPFWVDGHAPSPNGPRYYSLPVLFRIFSLPASCVESLFSIPIGGTVQRTAGKRRGEEASEQRQRGESGSAGGAHQQRRTRRERSNSSGVRQKREEEEQGSYGARPIEVRERLTPARPGLRTAARVRGGREGDSHGRRSTVERGEAESGGRRCRGRGRG